MSIFKNLGQLTGHGSSRLRRDALAIASAGVERVIPYQSVRELVSLEDGILRIGELSFDLGKVRSLYVVGAGKGAFPIAQALDEILGDRISEGFVIVKEGEKRRLEYIGIFESSHPIPDERSLQGAERIERILEKAGEGDLVLMAVTGGSSALMNAPVPGVSLADVQAVNRLLLNCGASIGKINAVRKHIDRLKGGGMVRLAQPAQTVTITFDTAPPDMPWPDLCLPDPSTFADAVRVLREYRLWDLCPVSIRQHLLRGVEGEAPETVKTLAGMRQHLFSVADPGLACAAAAERALALGYEPHILSITMEGEAKDLGIFMAGIADEILTRGRPFRAPCALITGGETTVTITGTAKGGGPNQETALGFASKIRSDGPYVFVSVDTDGTDGPCDAAGGIADASTVRKAREGVVDLQQALLEHDSMDTLDRLEDLLLTGPTGTNVMNLRILLIGKEEEKAP